MSLPRPIAPSQTDAKSPVDDNLMDSIREDLEYLDDTTALNGKSSYVWNVNGPLRGLIKSLYTGGVGIAKRIDMQFLHDIQTFTRVRVAQGKSGLAGKTEIDIRYHSKPNIPIIGIDHQFVAATQSVGKITPNLATQSVSKGTPQVNTQSISRAKAQVSITSIINVGNNQWRYNLSAPLDIDWAAPSLTVTIASCTSGGNNGTFGITDINGSGYPSFTVTNASGVAQLGAAGVVDADIWSYNLINPASTVFTMGTFVICAGHTNANNNSSAMRIYKVNQGGNNIWVYNTTGVAQAGVAGTVDSSIFVYTYASPVPNDFAVGEIATFTSHTSSNNGNRVIVAVNSGGNNIWAVNSGGVVQAGAAGVANTNRVKYSFSFDPSPNVSVGDVVVMTGHSNSFNDSYWTVLEVNDTTSNNIVIYNINGVTQGSPSGAVTGTKKIVKFVVDQSANLSVDSYIEMQGCSVAAYNMSDYVLPYKVLQVNKGGGANYNVVIDPGVITDIATGVAYTLTSQPSPAGFITIEAKSIFTLADGSKPQVVPELVGSQPTDILMSTNTGADIMATAVPAQTFLGLYILSIQAGYPEDLSVMLS